MIDPDVLDEVENEVYEVLSDFEDLSDEDLIECRDTILRRLNKISLLLNGEYEETDND